MENRNLDTFSLMQKINNRVILNKVNVSDEKIIDTLIKEKKINYKQDNIKNYISFIYIEYKQFYYPVFFYLIQHKKNEIQLLNHPIFCKITLHLLNSLGINNQDIHKSDDISTVILTLRGLIEKNNLKLRIVNSINFYSDDDLLSQDVFNLIDEISLQSKNQKLYGLFQESKINTKLDFYNYIDKFLDNYYKNRVSKLIIEDYNFLEYFIIQIINKFASKENITILCPDKETQKKYLSYLKTYFGSNIVCELDKIYDRKEIVHKESLSLKDVKYKKEFQEFEEKSKFFFELYEQNENIYKKYRLKDLAINEDIENVENILFDINTSSYRYNDLQKDEIFLNNIKNSSSILKSHITNHPFYGINENTNKNSYEEIINLIKTIKEQLVELSSIINNYKIKTIDNRKIINFKDIESLLDDVHVLNDCPNIPLEEFQSDRVEDFNNLLKLINIYHDLSASKLVIQTLTKRDFISSNLEEIVDNYNSKNLVRHFKGLKMIYGNLITKKITRVKPLANVITKYVSFLNQLKEILPKYEERFGTKVRTLSGLKEIESEYKNILSFNKRKEKMPYFTIDNPFIKEYLTNPTTKKDANKLVSHIEKKYQELKDNINKYLAKFVDDKKDFINPPISENISFFEFKSKGKEKDFIEFLDYLKSLKNTSQLLQLSIRKCIIDKTPLNVLLSNFVKNISKLNYKEAQREINIFKNDYSKLKSEYLYKLSKLSKYNFLDAKETIQTITNSHNINININKSNNQKLSSYFSELSSKKLQERLINTRITLSLSKDLIGLDDEVFDNIIITNSLSYSIENILNCLRLSKKVLFIDKKDNIDPLTQGYLFTNLSTISLINNVFDFSLFENDTLNNLKNDLAKKELKIISDDFIYIVDEKRKKKYILLPSSTFIKPIVSIQLLKTFEFIARIKKEPILMLDVIKYRYSPIIGLKEMYQPFIN